MATYNAKTLTITNNGDNYIIDPLQGNDVAYRDIIVNIDAEDWESSNDVYSYVWTNSYLTQNSQVQVYFKSNVRGGLTGDLRVQKTTGQITFSTDKEPRDDVSLLVRIIDSNTTGILPISADTIDTDAIVGETNVQGALEDLDTRVRENSDNISAYHRNGRMNITSNLTNLSAAVAEENLEKYGYAIGDYFIGASGYTYILADVNTFYAGFDDKACLSKKHIGIVVDTKINTTWGITLEAYSGSNLRTVLSGTVLNNIKSDLKTLFGGTDGLEHLLKHSKSYTTAMHNWSWYDDEYIAALTSMQVFGSAEADIDYHHTGEGIKKLEVFSKYYFPLLFGYDTNIMLRGLAQVTNSETGEIVFYVICADRRGRYNPGYIDDNNYRAVGLVLFSYQDVSNINNLVVRTNRTDYSSDEAYANYRNVTSGDIAQNVLHRSVSPIGGLGSAQALIADGLLSTKGINTVINLANSDSAVASALSSPSCPYVNYKAIYNNNGVFAREMQFNYLDSEFSTKIAEAFTFMATHEPPYLIHCAGGKDRTGFAVLILEMLKNATEDEIVEDYMESYVNFYGIMPGSYEYKEICRNNIIATMNAIISDHGTINGERVDFHNTAVHYLRSIGLSMETINQLSSKLETILTN